MQSDLPQVKCSSREPDKLQRRDPTMQEVKNTEVKIAEREVGTGWEFPPPLEGFAHWKRFAPGLRHDLSRDAACSPRRSPAEIALSVSTRAPRQHTPREVPVFQGQPSEDTGELLSMSASAGTEKRMRAHQGHYVRRRKNPASSLFWKESHLIGQIADLETQLLGRPCSLAEVAPRRDRSADAEVTTLRPYTKHRSTEQSHKHSDVHADHTCTACAHDALVSPRDTPRSPRPPLKDYGKLVGGCYNGQRRRYVPIQPPVKFSTCGMKPETPRYHHAKLPAISTPKTTAGCVLIVEGMSSARAVAS